VLLWALLLGLTAGAGPAPAAVLLGLSAGAGPAPAALRAAMALAEQAELHDDAGRFAEAAAR
jgi:hypothetical protein